MDVWIPLLSAFAGAIVGGAASVLTILIQSKANTRSDLRRQAAELALAEFNHHLEIAKAKGTGKIFPITAYFAFHLTALEQASKGKLDAAGIKELSRRREELRSAFDEMEASSSR